MDYFIRNTKRRRREGMFKPVSSSEDCLARATLRFRSFLRSQDPFPVRDPLPVGQIWGQIWGHVTCISQSEARDGAEIQDSGTHLHI